MPLSVQRIVSDGKMSTLPQFGSSAGCPVEMSDDEPCGRPIYPAPPDIDSEPVCLMHSCDPNKDKDQFEEEVREILSRTSKYHRPKDRFDFSEFVFPLARFSEVIFAQKVVFSRATFLRVAFFHPETLSGKVDFTGATFSQEVDFTGATFLQEPLLVSTTFCQKADFSGARFTQKVIFMGATFSQDVLFTGATFSQEALFAGVTFSQKADFSKATFSLGAFFHGATFSQKADFLRSVFADVADFRRARFEQPTQTRFLQVNRGSSQGLHARFAACNVEAVQFVDVHWYRQDGRMVLQDELDLTTAPRGIEAPSYELVAIAYRQLVNNFDKERAYDLADECWRGIMELKRRDPAQSRVTKAVVALYRSASDYGNNYQQALGVLVRPILLWFAIGFGILYLVGGLQPNTKTSFPSSAYSVWNAGQVGLVHSLEVATFQRDPLYIPATLWSWFVERLEQVFVPAQLSLFLLALRRRFRR